MRENRTADINILEKNVLTVDETCSYLGITKSGLYKLTHRRLIPYYRPTGGRLFFNREEIEAWMQQNRIATNAELAAQAVTDERPQKKLL